MNSVDLLEHQEKVSDLADKLLTQELAKGAVFSEGLSNWAINEAERQVKEG